MPIVRMFAPNIIGIDIKNENLRAVFSFKPRSRPVEMVVPEREIPGRIDNTCAVPIRKAFLEFNLVFCLVIGRLAITSTKPVIAKPMATIVRFENIDSKTSLKRKPIIAAGIVAIIKNIPNFPFSVLNLNFRRS